LKSILYISFFLALAILTGSWGASGHRKISTNTALSYNEAMHEFHTWTEFLSDHASDADYRKDDDPDEAPRHYIDIDSYYSFVLLHRIPQTLDSAISLYGNSFVYDNGILPWATESTFNALKQAFIARDFEYAKVLAADLGHYVGDGHMPLHITKNYDGQYTGNNGIHSRYESSMVNAFIDDIIYSGDSISHIGNVNAYIFEYLYSNYHYIDSILMADDYAKDLTGSTSSMAYKTALWNKTGNFTIKLMKEASHALCELIYTAWVDAGSPAVGPSSQNEVPLANISSVFDDPAANQVIIRYSTNKPGTIKASITDLLSGKEILIDEKFVIPGDHLLEWNSAELPSGIYVAVIKTRKQTFSRKFFHVR
jgi:hypothetical protein